MATPLINGRAYDYAQIEVNILGVPVAGISAISYTEEQEKVNNFGAGSNPVSRGREFEGLSRVQNQRGGSGQRSDLRHKSGERRRTNSRRKRDLADTYPRWFSDLW